MVSISQLLQRTGDGLVVDDDHQRIVSWNKAVTSILALSEQQAIGRPCYEVLQCHENDSYFFINSADCWVDADAFLDHVREGQLQQARGRGS